MRRVVVDLDPFNPASVDRANRILMEEQQRFERNVARFMVELAEIGRQAAQGAYGAAVSVTLEPLDDGVSIKADGRAVVFLEFGAGAAVNSGNRYADDMPFEVSRGSYSDSKNPPGPYAQSGYDHWYFGGVKYTEITPRNGMQKAYDEIMSHIQSVARTVFS